MDGCSIFGRSDLEATSFVRRGPALISRRRYLRWFGLVSLVGVIVTAVIRVDELTSLWCVYVAIVSVLILEHFRRQRASAALARSDPAWSS